jgi:hypothetical protein
MYEKRGCLEGVERQVMQDPLTMVKADCLKSNPQLGLRMPHRYDT